MLKKLIKPLLIGLSLVALYALSGFYLLPYALKTKLPALITEQTKTPATLANATFNPFRLRLVLEGFELKDKQKKPFLKFDSLLVDVDGLNSLKTWVLVVDRLKVDKLQARIALLKGKQFNFNALFPASKEHAPKKEQGTFPLLFKQVQLNEGSLTWVDEHLSKPETEVFAPLNLTLTDLSLRQEAKAKMALSTQLDVIGKMDWQLDFSLNPLTSKGHVQFKGIGAKRLWALFLQDQVNFKLPQGEADLSFDYDLAAPADKLQMTVSNGVFAARKLQFSALDNPKPLLTIPDLNISGIQFDLAKQAVTVAAAETKGVNLTMVSNTEGVFNLRSLFVPKAPKAAPKPTKTAPKPTAPDKPWLINIAKIAVHQLHADYQRQAADMPLQAQWATLDFDVADTQLAMGEPHTHIQSKAGKLSVQNLNLQDFKWHQSSPTLHFRGDKFQMELGHFQLDTDTQKPLQILADNGTLRAQNVSLQAQDDKQPLMTLADMTVTGAKLDLARQQVAAAKLQANGAKCRAWLEKDGQLNYQALSAEKGTDPKIAALANAISPDPAPPWVVSLADLDLQDFQLDFQDKTRAKPINMQLSALSLKAQRLNNQKGEKLPFTLRTKVNQAGSLNITGQAVLEPFKADLQATLSDLGLKTFQPYLNDYARVDIIDGDLDTKASIALSKPTDKAGLQVQVKGAANIKELVTRDQILNKDLVKWQAVKLDAIDFDLLPLKINIGSVLLQAPYARVTIKKDRTLNFSDIIVKQPPPAAASRAKPVAIAQKTKPPEFKVTAVTVANGTSDFSDFSLILPFVVELNELNGAVKGFSSEQKQLADFKMTGKVFDLSPMEMESKFSPDFSALDVGMHFKGMPLPFISPYMVEFAGYKIEKGKMSLDLHYKITDRKLVAENNMMLDQLTLGEKVENPKATTLPLNLAIALLKDGDGKININLPLTGSLDDPQFSVTALMFDAFVNMLTKVVSSPFKAFSALTSSKEDLSQVSFKEGNDKVSDAEQVQLMEVAKALAQKPELSVEIKGNAYTKQDWPALQDDALVDQLKAKKAAELKAGGKKQLAEYVQLSQDDQQRLVADLYIKKFPQRAKRSLFGTPELVDSDKDFDTVAKHQLESIIPPDPQRLSALALTRARNIAQTLIQKGKISQERIFILDTHVQPEAAKDGIVSNLSLRIQ